ncbi:bifunctional adenosylcobinamide kinase/adenosylcobinamide-phosphate guanylyltransferase [Iningainema tapete]|uniref:Adenosylcobinamide kinase n=1 Tax=Iningainema tapete BLCC-T55 TaxID=2748662 RepID=A0A8J6XDK9_9CYAN|nr:bifunctional adenosylcobinamide kinase/adenosylcobinamide-phosphate guanylyltransferase [Iningainema tapete BLCC-T55]
MSKVILVIGPVRCGKSEWAEHLAMESHKAVVYVATAKEDSTDQQWQLRIQQHKQRRPPDWVTLEVPCALSATLASANSNTCILVDSLGTWVANLLEQDEQAWQITVQEFLDTVKLITADVIFVAEETGWGVVPAYSIGISFRDRLGSLIRQLGEISGTVYLVTGGHVLNLSLYGLPLP